MKIISEDEFITGKETDSSGGTVTNKKIDLQKNKSLKQNNGTKNKKIYSEELSMLINNRDVVLSYQKGRKAFKKHRKMSYDCFKRMMKTYKENKGVDDLYFFVEFTSHRDDYLEWLYGLRRIKHDNRIKTLPKHDTYLFQYIIDAPYVYHDNNTGETYLYIEMHYKKKIKYIFVNSKTVSTETLCFRVVADGNELKTFKNEYTVSQRLAMITDRNGNKLTFYHDDSNMDLAKRKNKKILQLKFSLIKIYDEKEYTYSERLAMNKQLMLVISVLERYNLIELFGLLFNYKLQFLYTDFDMYYYLPNNFNGNATANLVCQIMKILEIDRIPVYINPNKKMIAAVNKGNNSNKQYICQDISGIIINTATNKFEEKHDKMEAYRLTHYEYSELESILRFFYDNDFFEGMWIGEFQDIESIEIPNKKFYDYLIFVAKYNSTRYNKTSVAAFNGIFYFLMYYYACDIIKYDLFFSFFEKIFGVPIQTDELIQLGIINKKDIITENTQDLDDEQLEVQDDNFVGKYENIDLQQSYSRNDNQQEFAQNHLGKFDIERLYQLLCSAFYESFIKYDDCDPKTRMQIIEKDTPFIKYIKKYNCSAFCFRTKDSEKEFFKNELSSFLKNSARYTIDEELMEMIYNYAIEYNKKIDSGTISPNGKKLIMKNVIPNKKCFVVYLDMNKY